MEPFAHPVVVAYYRGRSTAWMTVLRITLRQTLALLALALTTAAASAENSSESQTLSLDGLSPEQAGLAIFSELDRRDSGYLDLRVNLQMILRNSHGDESHRELRIRQLEVPEDGDWLLVVFDTPKPIRGTALLSYSHKVEPDDQWLYLPALKRVKRISSKNKSGPFLSSEFAYEDLALQEVEKFNYRLLDIETRGDETDYVVERTPVDEFSGYARQVVRLDIVELRIQRIDYFDRRNRPLKTLTADHYQQYQDRYWKAGLMQMSNVQTGKSTDLIWEDFEFATGLDAERDFSTNSLRRAR